MLYPQNGDGIAAIGFVTSLHAMYRPYSITQTHSQHQQQQQHGHRVTSVVSRISAKQDGTSRVDLRSRHAGAVRENDHVVSSVCLDANRSVHDSVKVTVKVNGV